MKCYVTKGEWYPVFELNEDTWGDLVEIPDELYYANKEAMGKFAETQNQLYQFLRPFYEARL
jgi:hypothetical protein